MNASRSAKVLGRNALPIAAHHRRNPNPGSRSAPGPSGIPGTLTQVFRTVVRSLIAVLLVWAGLSKLGDPVSSYTALLEYQIPSPRVLLKLVAVVLPWLELLCALMMLANFHRRLATLVVSVLFGVFLVLVSQAFVRGLNIACGCFNLILLGIDEASAAARFIESVGFAFFRNLILLGGALYLLRTDPRLPSHGRLGTLEF
jgi:putative oxidoreductase